MTTDFVVSEPHCNEKPEKEIARPQSQPEVGKHPDLMVGPPTSTVFPTNDRKFEISQFFRKKFEKI